MPSVHRPPHDRKRRDDLASAESVEPRGIDQGIADADKKARTGSTDEEVRNAPPAGDWNDTASD
jgi:hypothetical protein